MPSRSPATTPPTSSIAAYLELLGKRFTGSGSHGLLLAQDKAVAKKIFEFHGIHTPVFAKSFRGRLDFSHDLQFPVIVKPAREDGSIGIEFNAVVNSIRELMERIDWLHANFDSPVLIEEYIEGREMYVGVICNDKPVALPVIELDLSKLPEGRPRIAGAEVKWGKGTRAYRDTKSAVAEDLPEETVHALQQTAVAAYQALELRDYGRVDMRLQPGRPGRRHRGQSEPVAGSKAEFAMAARKVRPHLHAAHRGDRRAGDGAQSRPRPIPYPPSSSRRSSIRSWRSMLRGVPCRVGEGTSGSQSLKLCETIRAQAGGSGSDAGFTFDADSR